MFKKIGSFFSKLFTKAPSVLQVASSTLTLTAPLVEEIYTLVSGDPADATEAGNVIAEVQSGMAAASALIAQSHNSLDASTQQKLVTVLNAVKSNLGELLTVGHIKNPDTLTKVTAITNLAVGELEAIISSLPVKA